MDHIKELFHLHTNNIPTSKSSQLSVMNHIKKAAEVPGKAAEKVFGIAELAELILHGVDDAPTLVHARRVNKMFKKVIDRDMQLSKQKYWLACDPAALPARWYEDEDCPSPYPPACPEEIELNPWAAKGCIPKLRLQYTDVLFENSHLLYMASVVMMVDHDILDDRNDEWWHNIDIVRSKEHKKDLNLIVLIKYANSPLSAHDLLKAINTADAFNMHLPELEDAQRTLKGMIEHASELRDLLHSQFKAHREES